MNRLFTFLFIFICTSLSIAQVSEGPALQINTANKAASRGNSFNPDIGINTLFLYQNSNRGNDATSAERNGLSLQEAELQFSSDVDPYWRFVGTFSLHQEVEVDSTTTPPTRTAEYVFEPEEAFAESLELPFITFKAGKFKAAFGKHNQLHTHAFAFVDAPISNKVLLGDEGLNDVGISIAALIPVPWFSDFTLQGFSGQGEGLDYFHSPSANTSVGVARLRNLWDFSDNFTFELGLSAASGENTTSKATKLYGGDLTFKWRADKSHALIWSTEVIQRDQNIATDEKGKGLASWIQWQLGQRWWIQVRGETLEMKDQDPVVLTPIPEYQKKQSLLVGFIPSEFSGIRLQYDQLNDGAVDDEKKISLQFNYSIGAHPAHVY